MALIGAAAWCVFSRELIGSHWFKKTSIGPFSPLAMVLVCCTGSLLVQQLIERKGRKTALICVGALAILPFMTIIMMSAFGGVLKNLEGWIVAFSPIAWSNFAAKISLIGEGAYSYTPWPFWIAQAVMILWWFRLYRMPRINSVSRL